jgi:hypothetical protein
MTIAGDDHQYPRAAKRVKERARKRLKNPFFNTAGSGPAPARTRRRNAGRTCAELLPPAGWKRTIRRRTARIGGRKNVPESLDDVCSVGSRQLPLVEPRRRRPGGRPLWGAAARAGERPRRAPLPLQDSHFDPSRDEALARLQNALADRPLIPSNVPLVEPRSVMRTDSPETSSRQWEPENTRVRQW